jgi:outer membrane protein
MKHISTIISVIALAAVGILFYLVMHQAGQLKQISSEAKRALPAESRIAYFDMDTLEAHYDYFKDAQNVAKTKENAMNTELSGMESEYQKKIQEWRQKGNTMTQAESDQAQQEYGAMQQNLQARKDALQQELYRKTEDLKTSIRKTIEEYVKEYNKQRTYSFIFAYDPSSFIYYRDTVYNITSDLLDGLNAAYKKKD